MKNIRIYTVRHVKINGAGLGLDVSLGQHIRICDRKSVFVYSTVNCFNLGNISETVNGSLIGPRKNSVTHNHKGKRLKILGLSNGTGRDKVEWVVFFMGQKAKKWKVEK